MESRNGPNEFHVPFTNWWMWTQEIHKDRLSIEQIEEWTKKSIRGMRRRLPHSRTSCNQWWICRSLLNDLKKLQYAYSKYCANFHTCICLLMFEIKALNCKETLWTPCVFDVYNIDSCWIRYIQWWFSTTVSWKIQKKLILAYNSFKHTY